MLAKNVKAGMLTKNGFLISEVRKTVLGNVKITYFDTIQQAYISNIWSDNDRIDARKERKEIMITWRMAKNLKVGMWIRHGLMGVWCKIKKVELNSPVGYVAVHVYYSELERTDVKVYSQNWRVDVQIKGKVK